jgi:biotin synthase
MNLTPEAILNIAREITNNNIPDLETYNLITALDEKDILYLIAGADLIRDHFFKKEIHLCTICNGKSGRCTENCSFCSQSKFFNTKIEQYPLLPKEKLQAGAVLIQTSPVNRYSIVTSGKRIPKAEVIKIAQAVSELKTDNLAFCTSLGILENEDFKILKKAGISRYHHNLETARSYFNNICTTHSFDDRVNTIKAARSNGLSVCAGGLFGIGETDAQVLELALELRDLDVDAVPINFLTPIKGTPLEKHESLTPQRCLKIIALFRFVLPDKDIFICGGRQNNLKTMQPYIFHAGASGIMTGNYLTTRGKSLEDDLEMIKNTQFELRQ